MNLKTWVRQFKERDVVLAFFDILFLILPGVSVIFVFERQIFFSIDWIKLSLLSAAIIVPLDFMNLLYLSSFEGFNLKDRDGMFLGLTMSIIITAVVIYGLLAISYLVHLPLRGFVYVLLGFESVAWLISFYAEKRRSRKTAAVAAT